MLIHVLNINTAISKCYNSCTRGSCIDTCTCTQSRSTCSLIGTRTYMRGNTVPCIHTCHDVCILLLLYIIILSIIENENLRKLLQEGLNYRENKGLNWPKVKECMVYNKWIG